MPAIRPEFIQATEDNLPNSFLQPQWPDDIFQQCPCCHGRLHPKIHLSYGMGKIARILKKAAYWITIPWSLLVIVFGAMTAGRWAGFVVAIGICIPGAVLSVFATLCPRSRRVQCFPCKYSKDYPATQQQ